MTPINLNALEHLMKCKIYEAYRVKGQKSYTMFYVNLMLVY